MKKTIRAWVSGKVQGVFYRASTQRQAMKLGIDGYAKNLPDGRVEVYARGEQKDVDQLIAWLSVGPENSRVSGVQFEEESSKPEVGFVIL